LKIYSVVLTVEVLFLFFNIPGDGSREGRRQDQGVCGGSKGKQQVFLDSELILKKWIAIDWKYEVYRELGYRVISPVALKIPYSAAGFILGDSFFVWYCTSHFCDSSIDK
jgi:hypothetical protein